MDDYRPYLWGSAAASHYSVKGTTDTALWRQPSTSQVLDLLVPEIVNNTIKNFPVKRNWQVCIDITHYCAFLFHNMFILINIQIINYLFSEQYYKGKGQFRSNIRSCILFASIHSHISRI